MLTFANNFLAGGLLSLILLAFVFVLSITLLTYMVMRMSSTRGEGTPEVPGPAQPGSAGIHATGDRGHPTEPA